MWIFGGYNATRNMAVGLTYHSLYKCSDIFSNSYNERSLYTLKKHGTHVRRELHAIESCVSCKVNDLPWFCCSKQLTSYL